MRAPDSGSVSARTNPKTRACRYCALEAPAGVGLPLREFNYDYAYGGDSQQQSVYDNLGAPLLQKAFEGWNGTIFAYGQTGSGKSFSMTGSKEMPGIIPRLNEEMFKKVAQVQEANPGRKFLVTCSFLEIYNEVLFDLLDPSGSRGTAKTRKDTTIEIKEHPARATPSPAAAPRALPAPASDRGAPLGRACRCSACTCRGCRRSRPTAARRSPC